MKISTFALFLTILPSLVLANWPQFRGPSGQGLVDGGADLPLKWSQTENVTWKAELPGMGWSSPVIHEGKIYLTTAVAVGEDQEAPVTVDRTLHALCIDAGSGKIDWNTKLFDQSGAEKIRIHKKNSHASPTPTIAFNKLFVHFGHQGSACLNLDGSVIWKKNDIKYTPVHGNGGSPLVVGDKMIFSCDGAKDPFVVARNVRTGNIAWRTMRNTRAKRTFSFSTPLLINAGSREELIFPASGNIFAYNPTNGQELWRCNWNEGYSVVCRPVFGNGLVYASSGYDKPVLFAVKPGGRGDVTESNVAWTLTKGIPRNSSPLLVGEELYLFDDKGIGTCVNAITGDVHWQERVASDTSGSSIHANGRIYVTDERGTTYVLNAGTEFEVLAENALDERSLSSPAADGNALFIRTIAGLYRIEEK